MRIGLSHQGQLDKRELDEYCSYSCMKTYIGGTYQKCLSEALLISTYNICFHAEIRKTSPVLGQISDRSSALIKLAHYLQYKIFLEFCKKALIIIIISSANISSTWSQFSFLKCHITSLSRAKWSHSFFFKFNLRFRVCYRYWYCLYFFFYLRKF